MLETGVSETAFTVTDTLLIYICALRGYDMFIFLLLCRLEHSGKVPSLRGGLVTRAVRCNLHEISDRLCTISDTRLAHSMAVALDLAIVTDTSHADMYTASVQLTLLMARAAVTYFFLCVSEKGLFLHCMYSSDEFCFVR